MTVFRDYSQGSFNSVKHSWNFAGGKVRKLSRRKGGSIVGLAGKSTVPDVPTLVVSLGGLGGETLNEVKRKFNRTAAPQIHGNETVMFAEVDTCQIELNHLEEDIYDENSIGFMRDWEQLQIVYDCTVGAAGFVGIAINDETIPQHEWVDKNLPLGNGTQIDNSGAHARRQVGRLALSIKANYVHLLAMIEKKLKILCNYACVVDGFRQVNVMLVAGISGGTGGGCIIDFTYLLRLAAKRIGGVSLNINAILYTSDVQENLLPYLNPYFLKCNFIASMKEVDYFFKAGFTGEKYTFKSGMFPDGIVKTPDGSRVGDGESLFDSIILIQGFGSDGRILDKEVAINTVSDYIVNNLCCIELMDEINNLNEHGAANAIIPNIIQHNMRLPRDVHYSYRTIGYKSVKFPVEEIMTVVVAHVLDALHQKYQKNPSISGMDVLTNVIGIYPLSEKCFEIGQKNQRTIRAIRDSTLGYTNVREIKAFDMGQIYYPVDRYSYDDTWTENVYDYIVYIIKEELYRNGPYAALRLSQDICDCLERDLAGDKRSYDKAYLIDQTNRYRQNIENAKNSIETAGIVGLVRQIGAVFGDNSVQKQIDEFVNNLRNYDVARWKLAYYGDCMNAVEKLYQRLLKQHDEVFGRYVGAFLSVAETVKRDATEIVNSDYVDDKFCSCLLNPGDLSNDNSRLYDLIRYCIKPEDIEDLSKKFTESMLENEKKWTSMSDNEFDGVEQFKKIFDF